MHRSDPVSLDTLDPDLHALEAERHRNATERLELRARVEERGKEHVAREPADAVQVRDAAQSRPRAIRAAIVPGAEAVVDPDDGEAGGTRGEHRVQRRRPTVRRAVADTRGHADHRAAREPADEARERTVHPRDHDDAVGPLEIGERRTEPVDARDADVLVHGDGRPEQLRADLHLAHDRAVGRAGGDHDDEAAGLRHAAGDPDAACERVLLGLRGHLADGRARRVVGARREDASSPALEKRGEDRRDLLGRLALGENRLRGALAELAMDVDPGEPEVAIGQLGEGLERVVRARRPGANTLEQLAEIVAKPGHRAIVRALR